MRYGAEILMIFKNNNFIKLYIGLNILLFSLFVESKEFNYKFHWSYIPVAKLSVKFNESLSQYNANLYDVEFQIFTQGPLKLFRDYSSEGSLKSNSSESWDYVNSLVVKFFEPESFVSEFYTGFSSQRAPPLV